MRIAGCPSGFQRTVPKTTKMTSPAGDGRQQCGRNVLSTLTLRSGGISMEGHRGDVSQRVARLPDISAVPLGAGVFVLAQLIPVNGGAPITINKDVIIVGRQREHCDVLIDRKNISKLHCIIVKTDGLLFVRDLASTNGTKVNGQRITRGALLPGDQLAFAGEKFRVHLGPDDGAVSPADRTEMIAAYPAPTPAPAEVFRSSQSSSDVQILDDDDEDLVE